MSGEISKEEIESDLIVSRAQILSTIWIALALLILLAKRGNVGDMKPADWGDFVAGFTAPLAFGWLVVAVFIQRNELRAQIKELSASRKALEAQIEEQKITAQSLVRQNEILNSQWEQTKNSINRINDISDIIEKFQIFFSKIDVKKIDALIYENTSLEEDNEIYEIYKIEFSVFNIFTSDVEHLKNENDLLVFLKNSLNHYSNLLIILRKKSNDLFSCESLYCISDQIEYFSFILSLKIKYENIKNIYNYLDKICYINLRIMNQIEDLSKDKAMIEYSRTGKYRKKAQKII